MRKKGTFVMMKRIALFLLFSLALCSCAEEQRHNLELNSDADLAGLRVATIAGSCYDMELSARNDFELLLYNTDSDVLQALINDKADVAVHDEVVYNATVRKENGIKIAHSGEQAFPTAFIFRKEDPELAMTMTAVERRMVQDGSMQELKDFWLTDKYAEASTYTHIPDNGTGAPLRVGTCARTAPISFQINDDWYGIEIDLLRELGKELNRPLDIKLYDVSAIIVALKTGLVDVICGCFFVTPDREEQFLFSEPYHSYHPAYFVKDWEAGAHEHGLIAGIKKSIYKNLILESRWKYITKGLWETLKISFLAILLGSILGVGLYFMKRSRKQWVRSCAKLYNGFMAGIPELVLLLIMFYVVFAKSGIPPDLIAVVTFAMLFASEASDIYNTSLDAVPHGQTEAGLALGFTRLQTFFNIVMPQALRHGLPLYKGLCVSLMKGTSIVGYIAIHDLTRAGDIIRSRTFDAFMPLLVVTIIYFLLVWLLEVLLNLASPKKKVL